MEKIEPEDVVKDYLSVEELYRLAETPCKIPILKTASLFSCLTSLRISDILTLRWEEIVDFAAGGKCVHTVTQKTKTEDAIVAKEKAAAELKRNYFGPEGELAKMRDKLITPIQDDIYEAVKAISQQHGYDLIIDRASATGIIFANPRIDISDEILRRLGYSN